MDETPTIPEPEATTWIREDVAQAQLTSAEEKERTRAHNLRIREQDIRNNDNRNAYTIRQYRIWAPVIMIICLGVLALVGFVVHQISNEHAKENSQRVDVWCHYNPDIDVYDSHFEGTTEDVKGICN